MKVLLVGDYSGLHLNLCRGLKVLGVEVDLISEGDSWKKIPGGRRIPLTKYGKGRLFSLVCLLLGLVLFKSRFSGYDVVQFIAPDRYNQYAMRLLRRWNKKTFILACGTDSLTVLQWLRQDYSPLRAEVEAGEYGTLKKLSLRRIRRNQALAELVDGVIPISISYYKAYGRCSKRRSPIALPIDLKGIAPTKNLVSGRIKIFHGISRNAFKGSDLIRKAMERIAAQFPEDVEIEVVEKLPLAEYVDRLKHCNIFIDQAYSSGYGMNALIGLAYEKIVLSGITDDWLKLVNMPLCPIVNIEPCEDFIFQELERLVSLSIQDQNFVKEFGEKGRKFVEDYHESVKIAALYLSEWEK